jgi:hypothetical protein
MVISNYTIEVYRATFEQLLREANHARLANQFRCGSVRQLIGALITFIVVR